MATKDQPFSIENMPKMLQIREEAIRFREKTEKKFMKNLLQARQVSPRTYERKRVELETWVTKENEEINKTKKVFEEQWAKTSKMIEWTQQDAQFMKNIIVQSGRSSTRKDGELSSARQMLHPIEPIVEEPPSDEKINKKKQLQEEELRRNEEKLEQERRKIQELEQEQRRKDEERK